MLTRITPRTDDVRVTETPASSTTPQTQAKKRQKTTVKHNQGVVAPRKNNTGKRRTESYYCLAQMPLDILQSICGELEPIDLLHLLRVSKGFYSFLCPKTTAYVWRMAYENLSHPQRPPPCPLGINIIHYTNFLFGIHCQFCASRSANQKKHDTGFVRLCTKCIKTHTIGRKEVVDQSVTRLCHFNPEVNILKVEYNLRQKEMSQTTNEKTLSKYLEQRQQAVEYRSQHATHLRTWQYELTRLANQEVARIRQQRRNGIHAKLRSEACIPQHLLWNLLSIEFPHMNGERELTDDEWGLIRTDTIEYLFDYSENLSRDGIKVTLTDRLTALDGTLQQLVATRPRIAPTVLHVASWDPFSGLVMSSLAMLDVNNVLRQVAMLPKRISQWRHETDEYLTSLIPKSRRRNTNTPLELAITSFRCYGCTEPISYPRILMHHCFLRPSPAKDGPRTITQKKGRKQVDNVPREPRALSIINATTVFPSLSETFGEGMYPGRDGVSFHKDASTSARKIILACGENPDTITYTEMDQEDLRVECVLCSSTGRGRLVMRWTIAILHDLEKHGNRAQAEWRVIDSAKDLEKINREEAKMVKKSGMPAQYCRLCDQEVMNDQVGHLVTSHRWTRDKPNALEQFYTDIDQKIALPPLAVRI